VPDGRGGSSEDQNPESRDLTIDGPPGPSRRERLRLRRRRSRRVWAISVIALAVAATISPVAGYYAQRSWVKRTAVIDSQSCHPAETGGGNGARSGTFTACNLAVSFRDATGHSHTAHLVGIESTRIHEDTVDVYFSSSTSGAVINPQDRIPSWAFVLLGGAVWFMLGFVALAVYRPGRPSRARRSATFWPIERRGRGFPPPARAGGDADGNRRSRSQRRNGRRTATAGARRSS
jgi:hypothetical protein